MSHLEQVKGLLGLVDTITLSTLSVALQYRIRNDVLEHCRADKDWEPSIYTIESIRNWPLPMPKSFSYTWVDHPHRLYLAGKEAGWW